MKGLRVLVIGGVFAALLAVPAPSPGALALNVAPAKLEISMPVGTTYNVPITVHNGDSSMTHVQASMVDFTVTKAGDYQFEAVGKRPYSLMRWASINPREYDLPGNQSQMERLSIAIPNDKKLSGEYAGIVFFQTRPLRRAGAFAFSERIATKVYLTITGTQKIAGEVAKMTATRAPQGELYRILFKNTGNVHVYLNGTLTVQKDGQVVEQIGLPAEQLVERGGERLYEITGKRLARGAYQALSVVDYGGKSMTGGEISFAVR